MWPELKREKKRIACSPLCLPILGRLCKFVIGQHQPVQINGRVAHLREQIPALCAFRHWNFSVHHRTAHSFCYISETIPYQFVHSWFSECWPGKRSAKVTIKKFVCRENHKKITAAYVLNNGVFTLKLSGKGQKSTRQHQATTNRLTVLSSQQRV